MALKKVSPERRKLQEEQERLREEQRKKEMEEKKMNIFNNTTAGENNISMEKENTLSKVMEEQKYRQSEDSFFKSEELSSTLTPLVGLEIEIKPEIVIGEGRYKFAVENLGIENQVQTKYGMKDKLVVEFNVSRVRDGEEYSCKLKQKYNISSSTKSSFYQLYTDLTGRVPIGKINLRNLLGIKGICEVKHIQMEDGNIFPKVVNINVEINKELDDVPAV